jgi:hypothetical protein
MLADRAEDMSYEDFNTVMIRWEHYADADGAHRNSERIHEDRDADVSVAGVMMSMSGSSPARRSPTRCHQSLLSKPAVGDDRYAYIAMHRLGKRHFSNSSRVGARLDFSYGGFVPMSSGGICYPNTELSKLAFLQKLHLQT